MNRICAEQRRRNAATRGAWSSYAGHRERVTSHLRAASAGGGTLCVLGAGNANDLALAELLETFAAIELVDVDAEALAAGAAAQGLARDGRVRLHPGVELTGVAESLSAWFDAGPPSVADAEAVAAAADRAAPWAGGPFDVVASVGLLTQLIEPVIHRLPASHSGLLPVVRAIRGRHLRLLLELLRPGGAGLLVTEVVASDTVPDLASTPASALPARLEALIRAGNFFTGLNPAALLDACAADPRLRDAADARLEAPWLWDLFDRTYAVVAIRLRKKE